MELHPPLQLDQRQVSRVGLLGEDQLPPVVVELPHQGGVSLEGLGAGQGGGVVAPPEAALAAEGGDAGLRRDAGAGEGHHVLGVA